MTWVCTEIEAIGDFHDFSKIHDVNAMADVSHGGQVVTNKEIADAQLLLQVFEQGDDMRLNQYIKSGDGLIEDDQLGFRDQGTSNSDPLALTATELVRKQTYRIEWEPHQFQHLTDAASNAGTRELGMDFQWLSQDIAYPHPGA